MTMTTIKLVITALSLSSIAGSLIAGCAVRSPAGRGVRRCRRSPWPCMVNGEPITNLDIEQRTKLNFLTTHKQPPRQEVIDELIDEKVKIKEGQEIRRRSVGERYRSVLCVDELADAAFGRSVDQVAGEPGRPAGHAEIPPQGRHGLDQPGARPLQGEPAGRRKGRRRRRARKAARQAEAEAFEYKMQPIVLIVPRGSAPAAIESRRKEAEALRERVQTCERGQRLFQVDAERRDPRHRHQDLGRHPGPAARTARQDPDRPSDRARDHQAGRRDGGAVRAASRPTSTRRRSRKSAKRCMPRNTRRSRKPTCRKSAKPR